MPSPQPPGSTPEPAPDARRLHDAALRYLARYAATQAGLLRVLDRRIDRWAAREAGSREAAAAAREAAREVVTRLVAAGAVDDAAFAAARARSLARAGRSRRAIGAHLAARGVPAALADLPDDPAGELAAALAYVRRRRMGPFRQPPDPARHLADLGRLARAGFGRSVAEQALGLGAEAAEALIIAARQG